MRWGGRDHKSALQVISPNYNQAEKSDYLLSNKLTLFYFYSKIIEFYPIL